MGFEPTTSSLATRCSTIELHPLCSPSQIKFILVGGRGFEPPRVAPTAPRAVAFASSAIRPSKNRDPDQGVGRTGIEPVTLTLRVSCSAN